MKLHAAITVLSALFLVERGEVMATPASSDTKRLRTRSVYKSRRNSARASTIAEDRRNLQNLPTIPIAEQLSSIPPGTVPVMAGPEETPPSITAQPISVEVEDEGGLFAEALENGLSLPPPLPVVTEVNIYQVVTQKYQPRWYDRNSGWTGTSHDEAVEFCTAISDSYGLCPYLAICPEGEEGIPISGHDDEGGESWVPVIPPSIQMVDKSVSITANPNTDNEDHWVQLSSTSSQPGELFSGAETCSLKKNIPWSALQSDGSGVVEKEELDSLTRQVVCCLKEEASQSIFLPEPGPVILPEMTETEGAAIEKVQSCPETLDAMEVLDDDATLFYAVVPSFPPVAKNGLLCARLEVAKDAWLALAVSEDGSMIGSEAIIGLPDDGTVKKYNLASKFTLTALDEMEESKQTLNNTFITQEGGVTKMGFTKKLVEPNEISIMENGVNIFLHAYGTSNTPGYHAQRVSFKKDFKIPQPLQSIPIIPLEPGPVIPQPPESDEGYDPFLGMGSMSLPTLVEVTTAAPSLSPVETPSLPTCSFCPGGLTASDDTLIPFLNDGTMTCIEVADLSTTYLEGDSLCNELGEVRAEFFCCPPKPETPCEYCVATNGITVDGSLVITPDDGATCEMAVLFAASVEGTSEDCANVQASEDTCCPTVEPPSPEVVAPTCDFCPNGLTVATDVLIPFLNDGSLTCGEAAKLATTVSEGDDCSRLREAADFVCCPTAPEVPCNYCTATDGITVDGSVIIPDSDGNTCETAALFAPIVEGTSEECETILSSESTCCPASLILPGVGEGVYLEMSMSMPTSSPIKSGEDAASATPSPSSSSSPSASPTGRPSTYRPRDMPITIVKEGAKPSSAMLMGNSFIVSSIVMIVGLLHL